MRFELLAARSVLFLVPFLTAMLGVGRPAAGQESPKGPEKAAEKVQKATSIPLGPRIEISKPVLSSPPPATNHPQAVSLVNKYIDAVGGLKALEGIQDRITKFNVVKHAATGETKALMNLFLKKDYKIREEWDIEGLKIKDKPLAFVQVYNGSEGWVQMFGTVSPLEGKTLSLFVWDKLLDDFFCHWEEDGYTVDYVGAGSVENEPAEILETTDYGGTNRARYFFSKNSGLLLKREWREQGQNGLVKKETFYKKYRKLPYSDSSGKAVQFALLHEIYEDGDLDTTREFTEVKFNSGLKDDIFERPEGEEFKGAIGGGPPPSSPFAEKPGAEKPAAPVPPAPGGHPGAHPKAAPKSPGKAPALHPEKKPDPAPPKK